MNKKNLSQELKMLSCEFEHMEIVEKSSHKMTAYFSDLKNRPLSISNSSVKSLSKNNLKKVADLLKKSTCPLKALVKFSNDEEKLVELENTKLVTIKGVHALKIELSSENFDATGSYAKNATSFNSLNNGDYENVSIQICYTCYRLERARIFTHINHRERMVLMLKPQLLSIV